MPLGLASVIATMMLGKVGQAVADRNQKKDWRAKEGIKF
jgi:hypothetical protein